MSAFTYLKDKINIISVYFTIFTLAYFLQFSNMIYDKFIYDGTENYAPVCSVSQTSGCIPKGVSPLFFPKSQGGIFDKTTITLTVPSILEQIDSMMTDLDKTSGIKAIYGINDIRNRKPLVSVSDVMSHQADGLNVAPISPFSKNTLIYEILLNNGDVYQVSLDRKLQISKQMSYNHLEQ